MAHLILSTLLSGPFAPSHISHLLTPADAAEVGALHDHLLLYCYGSQQQVKRLVDYEHRRTPWRSPLECYRAALAGQQREVWR